MKIILRKVKIYGFDPKICRNFDNGGKIIKQYSIPLYVSEEDKKLIDTYLFDKVSKTQDGDFIFYGKSKQPIPVFDQEKKRIEAPINKVFIADVSILIDEFTPKNEYGEELEPVRYSRCLGIHYISDIENEKPKIQSKEPETFDEIFGGEGEHQHVTAKVEPTQPMYYTPPTYNTTLPVPSEVTNDDLPF